MANISSASGKITLKGDWTQEAIAALELVLDMWEFYGEYGIQSYDGFDEEHLTSYFFGCGRWSFSGTLDSFEDWTRDWLKEKPKRPNGELIHSLTEEQYENFLKIMCENHLVIEMDFEDVEEGCGVHIHEIGQFTSGDGSCISYKIMECEDIVQEATIRPLKNISVLREIDGCKIQKYIVLTIKASFIDMERKRRYEEPVNLDDETLEALFKADIIDAEEIPDVEVKLEVEKIRSEMGFREWILLEGKYILGYTHEELGALIGVAPNSVRMILCRAKEKARSILSNGRRRGGKNDEG